MISDEIKNEDNYSETATEVGPDGKTYVFFWGGPFSNWLQQPFVYEGITFNCAEQYMMSCKALLFGDLESNDKIMDAYHPAEQKRLGRLVKGFDHATWMKECQELMVPALVAKFTSTPRLKQVILSTGDAHIVEASPHDRIWGIGYGRHDPSRFDESKWGLNLLGEVLMKTREIIRAQA